MNDNRKLIEIAALLQSAAQDDDRLGPLATQATKLVLEDSSAVGELFTAFLNVSTSTGPQPNPYVKPPTKPSDADLKQAEALVSAIAKGLQK